MKIGIVSDIHAHLMPLKRAVSLFESQEVNHIICAGDLVDGGLDDNAVIDFVRSHNIISIQGNHDREAFADWTVGEADLWSIEDITDDDFGYKDMLQSYRAEYVRSLPRTRDFTWESLNVFLAHGAPWSDTYHVFPNVSASTCRKIFNKVDGADIVILGHTHIPMKLEFRNKWILNPGAICGNRDDLKQTCGILELPQAEFKVFDVDTGKPLNLETVTIFESES